ncbi:NUDIX domain-containing protein [Streptomyces sp. NPDC051636]|uniref:NUDIX domain-containing protein n=1 Tax=Streptomyces sp. NPDC051636 TaxID=3365663 RepID=UPI003791C762
MEILDPNTFRPSGRVIDIRDAWREGSWIGTFNLWIAQEVAGRRFLLYQQRAHDASWAPSCLDVAAGGHYEVGESLYDGLREAKEELGKTYQREEVRFLGRKLYLSDRNGYRIRNVVDVCIVRDDSQLTSFKLQEDELAGLFRCPLDELVRVHEEEDHSFVAEGILVHQGVQREASLTVTRDSFPHNWDAYHQKMAHLAKRFLDGESHLFY